MKKVMILAILVGLLIFSVTTSAFAVTGVYLDYTIGGNEETNSLKSDLDQYLVGVETLHNRFNFALEYSNSQGFNGIENATQNGYKIKAGYALAEISQRFTIFGNLSYLSLSGDSAANNAKYSPILVGVGGKWILCDGIYLDGAFDYAVNGKYKEDGTGDLDVDYMAAKAKLNYFLAKGIGVSVGYNWSEMKIKNNGTTKNTDSGYTAGLFFWF